MPFSLNTQDIVFAALLALFITWLVRTASVMFRALVSGSTEFGYRPKDLEKVLEKCYGMFPTDNFKFNGSVVHRGMTVRVLTYQRRTIEGQFVGINSDNMVCFITKQSIIAHELANIAAIDLME